jgi:hypothetical protein
MWRQFHGVSVYQVALDLEVGYPESESLLQMENSMILSRKTLWTRRWKSH